MTDVQELKQIVRESNKWLRAGAILAIVIFVIVIALQWQITVRNRQINDIQDHTEEIGETLNETQRLLTNVERVATDIDEQTPEEQQRNQAITEAVRQVPEIRSILCEAFPEATACQPGR